MAIRSSMVRKLRHLALVVAAVIAIAPATEALTCGQVSGSLLPCLGYLTGSGGPVSQECCSGIESLNTAAQTAYDRQTACSCIKSVAGSISGVNYDLAAGLPGQCGLSIPYAISPATDCSSVQ